jgi:ferritin-like metal-binding protein YciE
MKSSSKQKKQGESEGNGHTESENDLQQLFLDEMADIYDAEQQLTKALPEMVKSAKDDELKEGFESHLEETREHVKRLEQVAKSLGVTLKRQTCEAMKGLVEEAKELIEEHEDSSALDDALIAAAQKVEHYEIATYGTLCAWGERLGYDEPVQLLEQTLDEEKAADEKLTAAAETIASHSADIE